MRCGPDREGKVLRTVVQEPVVSAWPPRNACRCLWATRLSLPFLRCCTLLGHWLLRHNRLSLSKAQHTRLQTRTTRACSGLFKSARITFQVSKMLQPKAQSAYVIGAVSYSFLLRRGCHTLLPAIHPTNQTKHGGVSTVGVATIRGVYLAVVILCVLVGLLTFMHPVGTTERNIHGGKIPTASSN